MDREIYELGFDFIMRTNSKYYFQPDQMDAFETDIVQTFKTSKKVRSFEDSVMGKEWSEDKRTEHKNTIKQHREDTAKYFGISS